MLYFDFEQPEASNKSIKGIYLRSNNSGEKSHKFVIHKNDSEKTQKFTIAHQLFHHLLMENQASELAQLIIIHYTLSNPELTIKDIIYAIDQTYDYYESTIIESTNYEAILKLYYLLL